jgi:glycosyltransferase involved in cell wall biosynthesis
MTEPRRLRILVGAYAASPARGSEEGVAWQICARLARRFDIHLLLSPRVEGVDMRAEIAAWPEPLPPGLRLHFVEPPPLARTFHSPAGAVGRSTFYIGYAAWQRAALRTAEALHAERRFDATHQLVYTGYREPGLLWRLDAPFLWGPIGGAAGMPLAFLRTLSPTQRLFHVARNAGNWWQARFGRRCRRAARAAALVWHISDAEGCLVERWGGRGELMLETGTAPLEGARIRTRDPSRPLRVVWSGRHVGRKALPLLLAALERAEIPVDLAILGDGPERALWQEEARRRRLEGCVRWLGWLPRAAALDEMRAADVLAFTGLREGTPHVVVEALALGLPVLCHTASGMAMLVDETCGVPVPLRDPQTSIAGLAEGLRRLGSDPGTLERLSAGALRRAASLSWDSIAGRIGAAYEAAAAGALASGGPFSRRAPRQVSRGAAPASIPPPSAGGFGA